MPIDARIPLGVQTPQIDPVSTGMSLVRMRAEMENAAALREQRQALADQRQQQIDAQNAEAERRRAAADAVSKIKGGNAEEVLAQLEDPQARMLASDWLVKYQENQRKRNELLNADRKERAQLIRKFGYDRTVAEVMFGLDEDPQAAQMFGQINGDDARFKQLVDYYADFGDKPETLIQRDPEKDLVRPGTGEVVSKGTPKPVETKTFQVTVRGPNGRPMRKSFTEDELKAGVEEYREPKEGSSARFWVMRDGKPIRVSEAEYKIGDAPASTREQGRPVTSGDANKIADYDTSLDDLNTLGSVIAPKAGAKAEDVPTGTSAAIGAALPKWVTDVTGWGTDAKKKQALIDRVKQVIGKALEGGVLRKEDEYKYEKILPTIGDTGDVVTSKLNGLWDAIQQRRQTLLDSLGDAGYDVTKFAARPTRQRTQGDDTKRRPIPGIPGGLAELRDGKWIRVQ